MAIKKLRDSSPEQIRTMIVASPIRDVIQQKMGLPAFIEATMQLLKSPALLECTEESILGGILKAAIFGFRLSPELGQCWLVPRSVKTGLQDEKGKDIYAKVAVFQIGYKGWMELAIRSGKVESFDYKVVYELDTFSYKQGTSAFLDYVAADNYTNRGRKTHAWASAVMMSGRVVFDVQPIEEVERHRMMSDTQRDGEGASGIWAKHYDQMAIRIPMRYMCQLKLPKSELMQQALEADGGYSVIENGVVQEVGADQVAKLTEQVLHEDLVMELETAKDRTQLHELYAKRKQDLSPELLTEYQGHFKKYFDNLPPVNPENQK